MFFGPSHSCSCRSKENQIYLVYLKKQQLFFQFQQQHEQQVRKSLNLKHWNETVK